jgi:DNA repair exonuclease SbcCD ATPase subunit
MKLERIVLRSFLSHADTTWEPDGARLATLIGANGAGKSSLLDAVAYTLYDAARGRTDDLVKLGSSEMSATVEFAFAGARYRVTRGRSTRAGGKSFLELHVADGDGWRPLTADSIRETQAAIEQLLRMDAATFTSAALLQQGRLMALLDATPAERKRVLGTVLGLDRYERAEARTRELARDLVARTAARWDQVARLEEGLAVRPSLEVALREAGTELDALTIEEGLVEVDLVEHRAAIVSLAEQLAAAQAAVDEVRRLTAEVDQRKQDYVAAEQRRRAANDRRARADATLAQRTAVDEAIANVPILEGQLAEARSQLEAFTAAEQAQAAAQRIHDDATRDRDAAQASLTRLTEQRSDTIVCPSCGETIPAGGEALENRIRAAELDVVSAQAAVDALAAVPALPPKPEADPWAIGEDLTKARALATAAPSLAEAEQIRDEAIAEVAAAEADVTTATDAGTAARAALDAARERTASIDGLRSERQTHEVEVTRLEARARELAAQRRDLEANRARAQAGLEQLDAMATERDELVAAGETDAVELGLLERLVVAFGVNGIPARIIESVLPELSAHANEVLASLRPGMALEIRAQRARKSGTGVIEALDLIVRDDAGERSLALFSGGERMSVALALAVGLSRLVARRAGTAIRTLVVDEPDGLDADARRAFGLALRQLAHAGELERVVLVSHHPDLAEYGDAVYSVAKEHGGSVVTQVS